MYDVALKRNDGKWNCKVSGCNVVDTLELILIHLHYAHLIDEVTISIKKALRDTYAIMAEVKGY